MSSFWHDYLITLMLRISKITVPTPQIATFLRDPSGFDSPNQTNEIAHSFYLLCVVGKVISYLTWFFVLTNLKAVSVY